MLACAALPRARANARRAAPGWGSRAAALLPREKRLPADRARRPTGARPVDLIAHPPDGRRTFFKGETQRSNAFAFGDFISSDWRRACQRGRVLSTDWPIDRKRTRSEEHTTELQSIMRISYAVFCLKKKKNTAK